jgi:hypothetical protein
MHENVAFRMKLGRLRKASKIVDLGQKLPK